MALDFRTHPPKGRQERTAAYQRYEKLFLEQHKDPYQTTPGRYQMIRYIVAQPHPVCPPISAINGGPPFHPRCVHCLTPFLERLATEEEKKPGMVPLKVLDRTPPELQRRYREERSTSEREGTRMGSPARAGGS